MSVVGVLDCLDSDSGLLDLGCLMVDFVEGFEESLAGDSVEMAQESFVEGFEWFEAGSQAGSQADSQCFVGVLAWFEAELDSALDSRSPQVNLVSLVLGSK